MDIHTLYLNTATPQTSIAVYKSDAVIGSKIWTSQQNESETLLPAVKELLEELKLDPEDIQRLLVCVGPGGFTSTRIGVSAANAWAFSEDIPVASVSAFDLYDDTEDFVFVSANAKEAWLKKPGSSPEWVHLDALELPSTFCFRGILHDEWKTFLESLGGNFLDDPESFPRVEGLEWDRKIVKPWYYKDANITWSKKIQ